jgi:drug/metabolite transporter (DMT)-like permease
MIAVGGAIVFGRALDGSVLIGTIALVAGIALVASVGWRAGQSRAVGFALLTGFGVATYSLIDAQAVRQVAAPGYFAMVCLVAGVILVVVLRVEPDRMRRTLDPGLRLALGIGTAYLLVLLAFQLADPARVSALRESSILIAVWLGRERHSWHVWAGSALVVVGIFLATVG